MLNALNIFTVASGLSRHAALQQSVVSNNLANIDTPGYKSRSVSKFDLNQADTSHGPRMKQSRQGHISDLSSEKSIQEFEDKTAQKKPNGNSVALETETLKSIEAERMHSRAMAVYQSSLNILRSSMGRGR